MCFSIEFFHKVCGIICGTVFAITFVWFIMTDSDTAVFWGNLSGAGTLVSMVNYFKWQSPTYLNYRAWMEQEKQGW